MERQRPRRARQEETLTAAIQLDRSLEDAVDQVTAEGGSRGYMAGRGSKKWCAAEKQKK
jgi:hypothetical protein